MAAGAVIRVATAHRPPLVIIRQGSDGGNIYSGMLIDMLPRLFEAAEIRRPYELYELPGVSALGCMCGGCVVE